MKDFCLVLLFRIKLEVPLVFPLLWRGVQSEPIPSSAYLPQLRVLTPGTHCAYFEYSSTQITRMKPSEPICRPMRNILTQIRFRFPISHGSLQEPRVWLLLKSYFLYLRRFSLREALWRLPEQNSFSVRSPFSFKETLWKFYCKHTWAKKWRQHARRRQNAHQALPARNATGWNWTNEETVLSQFWGWQIPVPQNNPPGSRWRETPSRVAVSIQYPLFANYLNS